MLRPASIAVALATAVAAAGCGGSPDPAPRPAPTPAVTPERIPEEPTAEEVATIRDWSDALRSGDVVAAARFFALPAIVANPSPALRLRDREAVESFNAALPCGAKLVRTDRDGGLVVATFRLTERPGPGRCGTGRGALASTAFLIRNGLIERWLRVADPPQPDLDPS